ncbi:MAG: hypothetical protein HUJ97_10050 [Bacteroidales bacterium]|nr:hypothetical protein [Bacteroidales bacterium]
MSVNFSKLIGDLRMLVDSLMVRCTNAETKLAERDSEIENLKARIKDLETQKQEITSKYESLKAGAINGMNPEDMAGLKDKYLALVREIDDCISLMQHGRKN